MIVGCCGCCCYGLLLCLRCLGTLCVAGLNGLNSVCCVDLFAHWLLLGLACLLYVSVVGLGVWWF